MADRPRRRTTNVTAAAVTGEPDAALVEALARAEATPSDDAAWDALEELAAHRQQPDEVAALIDRVLAGDGLGPELASRIGRRAVRFHEEWYGDDPAPLVALLERVLARDPDVDWAFERLTLLLSLGQRWQELLALYDRALTGLKDGPRRRKLLTEAAAVAKDFAGEIDRAIRYLEELFQARPGDGLVASSLERLLERQGGHEALARVWRTRLELLSGSDGVELRARLATLLVDKLGDGAGALAETRALLDAGGDVAVASEILSRVVALPSASADTRRDAVASLRALHERRGRPGDVVDTLRVAAPFVVAEERVGLLREIVERLATRGDLAAAMTELVELCRLLPEDAALRTRLRHLAELSGRHDLHAQGLAAAAATTADAALRTELQLAAAAIDEDLLGDRTGAVDRYRRVAEDETAAPQRRLAALRRLDGLLTQDATSERLTVLEQRARLEPEPSARRAALGDAAALAAASGQTDRALAAWEARLAADASDREALDGTIALLETAGRPDALIAALRRRAAATGEPQRRADLSRVARLQAAELGDPAAAVDTWVSLLALQGQDGEDAEATAALRTLLARIGRWQDLSTLLARVGERDRTRLADLLADLGSVYQQHLLDGPHATACFTRALALEPAHPAARAALGSLVDDETCRAAAIEPLVRAMGATDDWRPVLALLEHRLALAPDDGARAKLLVEAAELNERRAEDPGAAFALMARALPLTPDDGKLESAVLRLGAVLGTPAAVVDAFAAAAARLPEKSARLADLRLTEATLAEQDLADPSRALDGYSAALRAAPERTSARLGVIRTAGKLGRFDVAAAALLGQPLVPSQVDGVLASAYEAAAREPGTWQAWTTAADALSTALNQAGADVPRTLVRDLELRVAGWMRDRAPAGEDGTVAAEAALLRAVAADPLHRPALERLIDVQRSRPSRALFDSLLRLASVSPTELDPLVEAAELARDRLGDKDLARQAFRQTLDRASQILRSGTPATGSRPADASAVRALESLAELHVESGDRAEIARAVDVLLDGSRLPLPADTARGLRRRAARLALDTLGDKTRARDILRRVVDDEPSDRDTLRTLAQLYEEAELHAEVLVLRRRELSMGLEPDERVALRLELVRIAGLVEERSARIETLLANLEDRPGHGPTLQALGALLGARGKHGDMADILAAQARKLEELGETNAAGVLWGEVAALARGPVADPARALAASEKMATLDPSPPAFASLAALFLDRGDHAAAAGWLERLLASASGTDRIDVSLRLVDAYLAGGQRHRAIACLERALSEDSTAQSARSRLADLYRQAAAHEPLARTLAEGLPHLQNDPATLAAHAREAAALFQDHLAAADRAVPVLEQAVAAVPGDRALRTQLAEALRRAGRPQEARQVLTTLLEELGRRRSKERASVHHQLALAARAAGDLPAALENLDQAAAIDLDHPGIQLALAEAAEEAGDLDRAERALRALLVLARRAEPDAAEPVSVAETLLRLEHIARERGATDAAAECLDSAMATALQSPHEAARLQAALLARKDVDGALGLLERRRAAAADGRSEATVLCETADALEALGRGDEALERSLRAIDRAPDSVDAHRRARTLAVRLGQARRYLDALTSAIDQRRRWDDAPRVCELLLRAGEVAEGDLSEPRRAAALFARAEQTGARSIEVLEAVARISAALGDRSEEDRAIRALTKVSESAPPAEQADALYRLAALLLADRARRDQGLEALARALDAKLDFTRAIGIVRGAGVPDSALHRVMPLYEKVARASGDERMLLDFLERRVGAPEATQDEVREAVELSVALGESDRTEKLLERSVSLARRRRDPAAAAWALLDLAQRRKNAGDLATAARFLEEAGAASDSPRVPALLRELAREAERTPEGTALAARVFEGLRTRNPVDRSLWEPLLSLHAKLGDRAALDRLVADTAFRLASRSERSFLRMGLARFLAEQPDAAADAISTLRDVLMDDPGHREALMLLADLHERGGDAGEAVSLLSEALKESPADDEAFRAGVARRLGDLLRRVDPGQARQVYRTALSAPLADPALRRALRQGLLDMLTGADEGRERADLMEQMLPDDEGAGAAERAIALANARTSLGDAAGALRALEMGHAKVPQDGALFDRLMTALRAGGDLRRLVALLEQAAARADRPELAAAQLREAAVVTRDQLGDPARAAELLRTAFARNPADPDLLRDLTATLSATGQADAAIAEVDRALADADLSPNARASLLRLRADLHARAGRDDEALAALEEALALAGATEDVAGELITLLSRIAARASRNQDLDAARRAVLRLSEVHTLSGQPERAQSLLSGWAEQHPEDREVLHALRTRAELDARWQEVARICARLVDLEEGETKIEAALGLAHACEEAGSAAEAVPALEHLLQSVPSQPALLARLAALYEATGDRAKLAQLMIDQAERAEDEETRFRGFTAGAELLLGLGDAAGGFAALEKAAALRPSDVGVRRLMIDASLAAGLYQEAAQAATTLLGELRGADPTLVGQLFHRLARAHAGMGDREGQLQALKRALDSDRKNGDVAAEVADVAEEIGDDDLALKALRTVTLHAARGPMTPAIAFFRQARIAFRQGDRQRALIFAKRALQENPGLDDAQELLRQLR